jgi:hypothetical protein
MTEKIDLEKKKKENLLYRDFCVCEIGKSNLIKSRPKTCVVQNPDIYFVTGPLIPDLD